MERTVRVAAAALACVAGSAGADGDVPYGVGNWPAERGNHRAVVHVAAPADAVRVHLSWRRRDSAPERKRILIVDATTDRPIANLARISVTAESGDLAFQPATVPGYYHIYYLPSVTSGSPYFPVVTYPPPDDHADAVWLDRNGLGAAQIGAGRWRALPEAAVRAFEARGEFHRFDPMELPATAQETAALRARHPSAPFLLFPEDGRSAIRMADRIPVRWARRGPGGTLALKARPGAFCAFQVGVWAPHDAIAALTVRFGALAGPDGARILASALRCVNTGGRDWLGRPVRPRVSVPAGGVQALWCGIETPRDAPAGVYRGRVRVGAAGGRAQSVEVALTVGGDPAGEDADDDPAAMTRLRWLDSPLGLDDDVVAPYTPLQVRGAIVQCLGRTVTFGPNGLPAGIRCGAHELLARPIEFTVTTAQVAEAWHGGRVRVSKRAPGAIQLTGAGQSPSFDLQSRVKMEADGYLGCEVTLTARHAVEVADMALEIPLRREMATYMMGLGRKGGLRPPAWQWHWDVDRANNAVWVGEVEGGIQCKLKGDVDTWDLYNLRAAGPPRSWHNEGRGGCAVEDAAGGAVQIRAYTGARRFAAGETVRFRFGLLITPVKPLDPAHWSQRYYHDLVPPAKAASVGATIINVHQGNPLNPNINYPFLAADKMSAYVRVAHALGIKVKIYYTVRELSNYTAELWALRSLGHEVLTDGPGGGDAWLQEHLGTGYAPAWHTPLGDGVVDAAIAQTGLSRWHNYYLEGLAWLLRRVQIDGLYLDGIGYDREIMKRVRKVLNRTRPGSLIDFHSGNNFHPEYGLSNCANQYMEHFPYVDSLWFGEGFDYNETPDYWLVEVSGIPFGLYGEMLQDNGNPWRGMVYGMTARYYSGADPQHIWRLWDSFGIAQAKMRGYWERSCPVHTDHPDVLATAYVRKGRTLIALASWAKERAGCALTIDWRALGIDPSKARLSAPAITGFQPAATYRVGDTIPVDPGRGLLLVLDEAP